MRDVVRIEDVQDLIVEIRGEKILLDADVAKIYGVETKRINEAVKNNPEKFPEGYILDLADESWEFLRSKFSTLNGAARGEHRKYKPKAFTERGLYMLATILKGDVATETTLAIVDTFYKIRHLSRNLKALTTVKDKAEQKALMQKSGEMIAEVLDNDIETKDTETTIELNFALLKFKHAIKKKTQ